MKRKKNSVTSPALTNQQIVTLAVFLCGGDRQAVDTEDVAVRANTIAPGRFSWRKYKGQISLDTVRKRLWDSKRPETGAYLIGSERRGWSLTQNGLVFARKHAKSLSVLDLTGESMNTREKRWRTSERIRMLTSEAFLKYAHGRSNEILPQEAASFFRVDEYIAPEKRGEKILRIVNVFGDDPELGNAVTELASTFMKG